MEVEESLSHTVSCEEQFDPGQNTADNETYTLKDPVEETSIDMDRDRNDIKQQDPDCSTEVILHTGEGEDQIMLKREKESQHMSPRSPILCLVRTDSQDGGVLNDGVTDVVDESIPEEIQAEFTLHAQYHLVKSRLSKNSSELGQFNIRDSRNPECQGSNQESIDESHERINYNDNHKNSPRGGCYFGSEASVFCVSDASINLEQLTENSVVEEVNVSSGLNELGIDDEYLQGLTVRNQQNEQICNLKSQNGIGPNSGKNSILKKMSPFKETKLVDASSISKIKSMWAKTCPSPKPCKKVGSAPRKTCRVRISNQSKIAKFASDLNLDLKGVTCRNESNNSEQIKQTIANDSEHLQKFNIVPCSVRVYRLETVSVSYNVNEVINKSTLRTKEITNSPRKREKIKRKSKSKVLKEEKNKRIVEMTKKLGKTVSVHDITYTDDVENDEIGDELVLSDDEYTPTDPSSSLNVAFVKSSRVKRRRKDPKNDGINWTIDIKTSTDLPKHNTKGTGRTGRPPKPRFKCKKCDFITTDREVIERHHKKKHERSPLTCHYCDRKFRMHDGLLEHEAKVHTNEKPFKCQADGCPYASKSKTDLARHQAKHASEKNIICTLCGWTTRWIRNLSSHHLMKHTEEKKFKCTLCKYVCKRKTDLKQHMFRHTDEKPIKCMTCGFSVKTNWELKSHMLSHSDVKPFKCTFPGCKAATKLNSDLLKHMRKVHNTERNFICTICGKGYKDQQALNKHHSFVHVTTRSFICDICNKGFKNKPSLRKHLSFHAGYKPYQCSVCKKTFGCRGGMLKHMETHDTTSRPYRCPICLYAAKKEEHLLGHIGAFHKDSHCYFCEICKKPFNRYSRLQIHYQKMHKSELHKLTTNGQIELEIVKSEYLSTTDADNSDDDTRNNSRKRKSNQNQSEEKNIKTIEFKKEPVDEEYETEKNLPEDLCEVNDSCKETVDGTIKNSKVRDCIDMSNVDDMKHENFQLKMQEDTKTFGVTEHNTDLSDNYENQSVRNNPELPQIDQEQNNQTIINPENDSEELMDQKDGEDVEQTQGLMAVNKNESATLAVYKSLRLPLATQGFDFNYEKTGKKPKAWFMDIDLMNPTDANRHKAYLRRIGLLSPLPKGKRKKKNLEKFLKKRSEKRNKNILQYKVNKSPTPSTERRREQRKTRFNGTYSGFDDNESANIEMEEFENVIQSPKLISKETTETPLIKDDRKKRNAKSTLKNHQEVSSIRKGPSRNLPSRVSREAYVKATEKKVSPKEKVKVKRKPRVAVSEVKTCESAWKKKYIPAKQRKTLQMCLSRSGSDKIILSKIDHVAMQKVSSLKDSSETYDQDSSPSDKDITTNEDKGNFSDSVAYQKGESSSIRSSEIPDLNNYCDDVLVMREFDKLDTILAGSVVNMSDATSLNSIANTSKLTSTGMAHPVGLFENQKYFDYKINLTKADDFSSNTSDQLMNATDQLMSEQSEIKNDVEMPDAIQEISTSSTVAAMKIEIQNV